MINDLKLKAKMVEKGYSQLDMADYLNISYFTFNLKINNKRLFTLLEVQKISELLGLTEQEIIIIFFTNNVYES
ncbi:MAG TPA: DUF739 domain-containing protein [Erysipelotrichaceae bacterium]|nr:DUF739 domain-containing protein [Erysipelotrichaceae bacterium]